MSRHPRLRRAVRLGVVSLVGLLGAFIGIALGAQVQAEAGPFESTLTLRPSLSGGTVIHVAPLGRIRLDTHAGPLSLHASLDQINSADATAIVEDPTRLAGIEDRIARDVRAGLRTLAFRAILFGALGAAAAVALVVRRPRAVLVGLLAAVVAMAGTGAAAAATWRSEALNEPEYTGLLSRAPAAIGDARQILSRFSAYRTELAGLILNVSRLYETAANLPSYSAGTGDGVVRVLHVADIHLNPAAFDLVEQLVEQFDITVVVDSGDIADWGSVAENGITSRIGGLGVPYVYARGNHDSLGTEAAVRAQPNAVVLNGEPVDVAGIRFWGMGDPRFTPDKRTSDDRETQRTTMQAFAETVETDLLAEAAGVDVAVLHDPAAARAIMGDVPLILAGHSHRFSTEEKDGTRLMVQGSTGGAGLRGLEGEEPTPLAAAILYLDKETGRLAAYDSVRVGGLGQESVNISRHVVGTLAPVDDAVAPSRPPGVR
ncbi:MAG TPA: metallophosphoesterase [Mycobacteriales bacterium]|jgi:predicted phosphodiesterase|nr:metallophosphoesterase [Mycobacteriales bacterium]